ncbi:hypothetical protein KUTeg_003946 [Tegillarca granosa]|uniref:Uncharacterized protein n=1 Tax=Tegillarca granosa TaxID=220873 RepID=A0ABQ9FT17_TEGGR|nr:hypothetical protein KUTeg_003946 [Tegillarca granosa]
MPTFSGPTDIDTSGVSARPSHRSYREYLQQQRQNRRVKDDIGGGPKLWRQMMIGFIGAACVGLIMLILGEAIKSRYSITIMLCVMGMVCGLIIVVGTVILGKLFISRKWRIAHGRNDSRQPPQECFHTCSVIYTPSQDQLAFPIHQMEPPPPYESIMMTSFPRSDSNDSNVTGTVQQVQAVMAMPPNIQILVDQYRLMENLYRFFRNQLDFST